ncbi:extracellular solute-binding protein [Aquihabitans daechungensis]|uniref:extracellular solute-binding protein n=1 Tax=Aquihabitans daechungensis TaxID=1052257 RepID=UPI003BA25153
MTRHLRTTAAAAIAVALLLTTACAESDGGSAGSSSDSKVLHVYSGRHYDVEKAFQQFEEETGTKVEFLTGNDAELRERIAAEGEDTEADAFITVDAGNLANAAEDGLFQPMDSPELRKVIPAQYRDPDDLWFGLALRARSIIYNTDALDEDEVPKTYADLAKPEWKGRVCLRNSTNDYQQSLVASMIAQDGEAKTLETLEGWTSNAEIYANDVELIEAMAAGACDVGIANHYYLARQLEEDPDLPVDLIWADQGAGGTHINISGGGITKHAENPELRPGVPGVAGHQGAEHPGGQQPRVPGQHRSHPRAAHHRGVRRRLRAPDPRCQADRRAQPRRRGADGPGRLRLSPARRIRSRRRSR